MEVGVRTLHPLRIEESLQRPTEEDIRQDAQIVRRTRSGIPPAIPGNYMVETLPYHHIAPSNKSITTNHAQNQSKTDPADQGTTRLLDSRRGDAPRVRRLLLVIEDHRGVSAQVAAENAHISATEDLQTPGPAHQLKHFRRPPLDLFHHLNSHEDPISRSTAAAIADDHLLPTGVINNHYRLARLRDHLLLTVKN